MNGDNLQAVLDSLNRHWLIIPIVERDKRPIVPWLEFRHRRASVEDVAGWNRAQCQPPLDDDEVIRTVQSIAHLHEQDQH